MPEKQPQPKRLSSSASAPVLSGQPPPGHPDLDGQAPPGYPPESAQTRPGKNQLQKTGHAATFGPTGSTALYSVPSFGSLYVEPQDLEPGPGTYDIPSGMGAQLESTKESHPLVSLTAKHDKSWAKVMISKDHNDAFKCRSTPGPGTYKPQLPPSQARVRFGTGKRPGLADCSFRAPGPVYEVRSVPDNPSKQNKFSKADRFSRDGASLAAQLAQAGPGQYEVPSAIEGGRLAKSFGASHRAYDHVKFPGAEKAFMCRNSPGPGALRPLYNDSVQLSFSRADRLPASQASKRAPGPGAYDAHERPYPFSRNPSVCSFGRPHAKGRINWGMIRYLSNSTWGLS